MATVIADLGACQGYANCVAGADDYFDIDDDGVVDPAENRSRGVRSCSCRRKPRAPAPSRHFAWRTR